MTVRKATEGPFDALRRVRFLQPLATSIGQQDANYGQLIQDANLLADRVEALEKTLRYMADYQMTGSEMTLHIDFQGKAREALAG